MRTFKMKKLVETEVSAEEVIAALRAAFDPEKPESACPFQIGDIVDVSSGVEWGGGPVVDDEDEPVQAGMVVTIDESNKAVEISIIDSMGERCEEYTYVKWDTCVLLDRKA